MVKRLVYGAILTFLNAFLLLGCGSKKYSSTANNILERTWTQGQDSPPEKDYCSTATTHTSSYTISGTASFEYRPVGTELGNEGLLDIATEPKPIRHAQYDVTDASGTILQCGETDGLGNFSFTVSQNQKALSLNIYARSDNNFNRASVFIAPETNELHKLQHFFTANKNQSNILLVAEANKSLIGGAFNILDQIHQSFDALKLNTQNGQGIDPVNIPKVSIYWEKGFNPGVYVGKDSGLSFFSRQKLKLFILGGLNGDTDFADTDHFDNSIILHEYFHFLESTISRSSSPGGEHNGNQILDPRLAWSEGAAQFYQAFVTGIPSVLDTRGNVDGSTGFYLKISVENKNTDIPIEPGEGEFREFAVARMLWDIHDTEVGEAAPEDFDRVSGYFRDFWRAFSGSGTSADFKHDRSSFASSGLLLEIIDFLLPAIDKISTDVDWSDLLSNDFINHAEAGPPEKKFRAEYAQSIVTGVTQDFKFVGNPYFVPSTNLLNNHPSYSMDYYSLQVLPGGLSISVSSTTSGLAAKDLGGGFFGAPGTAGTVQMYVLEENYSSLEDYIIGPVNEGALVALNPGRYLILVVISQTPGAPVPATGAPMDITYNFPGFSFGGF